MAGKKNNIIQLSTVTKVTSPDKKTGKNLTKNLTVTLLRKDKRMNLRMFIAKKIQT